MTGANRKAAIEAEWSRSAEAPRHARILSHAARSREDADYDAAAVFSPEDADEWIANAREFRSAARAILVEGGWIGSE